MSGEAHPPIANLCVSGNRPFCGVSGQLARWAQGETVHNRRVQGCHARRRRSGFRPVNPRCHLPPPHNVLVPDALPDRVTPLPSLSLPVPHPPDLWIRLCRSAALRIERRKQWTPGRDTSQHISKIARSPSILTGEGAFWDMRRNGGLRD